MLSRRWRSYSLRGLGFHTKDVTNKKFGARVRAILKEEQGHLELCTKLAKVTLRLSNLLRGFEIASTI